MITQNAPRVLADDPPDLMRLPQVSELVKDGLLKNLDGYAKAFGWDKWPASQLEQMRLGPGGRPRGEGSLYAMGLNFSMTGVFYNKKLAAQIGMTAPPADAGGARRRAGEGQGGGHHARSTQFNGGATGGLAFPLQDLMASYGPAGPDQRLDLPEAGRHDRHAGEPAGRPAPGAVDQGRLLRRRTSTRSTTRR